MCMIGIVSIIERLNAKVISAIIYDHIGYYEVLYVE
jgi:hypothetical protein